MQLISSPPLRTIVAAIVLATGCGDSGTGSDSNGTDAASTSATDPSAGTDAASTGEEQTTDAPTTDAPTTDAPTTGPGVVSYTADVQPLWDARCVTGCHEPAGELHLE